MKKKSTVEKFWNIAYYYKLNFIFMLCQIMEDGVKKCDEYFPNAKDDVLTFGPYKLTCTNVHVTFTKPEKPEQGQPEKPPEQDVIERTVVISVDGEPNHTLTHVQYLRWPDKSVPEDPASLVNCWKTIRNSPKGAMIHCHAGIGRTGSVAYLEMLYQEVCSSEDGKVAHGACLFKLRASRARSIQYPRQFAFAICALVELLVDGSSLAGEDLTFVEKIRIAREENSILPTEIALATGKKETNAE